MEATEKGTAAGGHAVILEPEAVWDLAALWHLRELVWAPGPPAALTLDFSRVRSLDPTAVLLLHMELLSLAGSRTRVRLTGLQSRLRRQLRRHPILRFFTEDDVLFTDPDLEASGFRPSRH